MSISKRVLAVVGTSPKWYHCFLNKGCLKHLQVFDAQLLKQAKSAKRKKNKRIVFEPTYRGSSYTYAVAKRIAAENRRKAMECQPSELIPEDPEDLPWSVEPSCLKSNPFPTEKTNLTCLPLKQSSPPGDSIKSSSKKSPRTLLRRAPQALALG